MKKMNFVQNLIFLTIALAVGMTACGGSDDSENDNTDAESSTKTGFFLDSPV